MRLAGPKILKRITVECKVYIICYISRGATNSEDDIYLATHQHGRKEVLFRFFYLLLEFFMHVFNNNQSPFLGISSIFGSR